ncbi:cellulase family glycosylhydrolase [Rhodococcoides kyotonense]|uniref:LGFP repeat-containing protein n=1 Tax=Rhodococcoides kyotonense TaxID=398843 RepID=A0A239J5P4_9NOCA|nr:cellulase family glycosylhydrolase [Rhodococcus kyotonensis]SNT01177.1 LGFP repeat-containing protein [Rhodococcus kyotonensis]
MRRLLLAAAVCTLVAGCTAAPVQQNDALVLDGPSIPDPDPASLTPIPLKPIGFTGGAPLLWASEDELDRSLDAVAASGSSRLRLDMAWPLLEPQRGLQVWEPTDRVVDAALERGIEVLAILDYTPEWAAADPQLGLTSKPASAEEYGQYAGQVAQHFSGRVQHYEIWNEPNGKVFFAPWADPELYAAMLQQAYTQIKAVDPDAVVVGGAIGAVGDNENTMNGLTFLQRMYQAGAQGYFDVLSVHPYSYPGTLVGTESIPDGALRMIADMRREMLHNGDDQKQIWATEFGSPTDVGAGITEDRQGELMSSFIHEWSQLPYAGPMYVHEIRDRLADSQNPEDNFGVLRRDFTPKPAYEAVTSAIASGMLVDPDYLGMHAVAQSMSSLGEALTPVYPGHDRIGRPYVAQQFEGGMLFRSHDGYVMSPHQVSAAVLESGFLPSGPYVQGMQQLNADGGARVFYSERTGVHLVRGAILDAWTPEIGYPTSEEYQDGTARVSDFEFGSIRWESDSGAQVQSQ